MKNSFSFFKNTECEMFPCHKTVNDEKFNCLFCFCPLYNMKNCGGNFTFTENGAKDCSNCLVPHKAENYQHIIEKLKNDSFNNKV